MLNHIMSSRLASLTLPQIAIPPVPVVPAPVCHRPVSRISHPKAGYPALEWRRLAAQWDLSGLTDEEGHMEPTEVDRTAPADCR